MTNVVTLPALRGDDHPLPLPEGSTLPSELGREVEELRERIARMESAVLEQNGLLRQLVAALGDTRVTRTQERAVIRAISERSDFLVRREGLPASARRRVSAAIRQTLRQTTGTRAAGDLKARDFEKAVNLVNSWDMPGALRRIRRECNA